MSGCNIPKPSKYPKTPDRRMKEYIMIKETGNAPITVSELIRCKDCIHHHGHDCENMNYRWTSDDFYCGWAERKEE